MVIMPFWDSLRDVVNDNVMTAFPKEGPASLTLYSNDQDEIVAAVVNINHALFDAITMKAVLQDFGARLFGTQPSKPSFARFEDWGTLVRPGMPKASSGKRFLPIPGGRPLRIDEVLVGGHAATSDEPNQDVVTIVSREVAESLLTKAREHSTTLTGVWMASLFWALSESYFRSHSDASCCCLGISVLVDLRPTLEPQQQTVLQIQSTVTVGRQVDASEIVDSTNVTEWLWRVAKESKVDLTKRVERGEAHRQAMALSQGNKNEACPLEATIELSNHGIYQLPEEISAVEVSQRYDGYQGFSIIVHSESNSKILKGTASYGSNIDHVSTVSLMNRVQALFQLMSTK